MPEHTKSSASRRELEDRIRTLEEQARLTLDILEMASSLGDFQTSINKLHEPNQILAETAERISRFVSFHATAFYLVDEDNNDFVLASCEPSIHEEIIRREVSHLIDTGIFAMAIRENRPITVYSQDGNHRLVLHVLATSSRVRGMFIGLTTRTERSISSILLALLSIVLKNCANAIESFELYQFFYKSRSE
ncbi:GAF domain-containing protein [Oceanidesulfovibrio marinus]|uniref:GAF domain-containing protein n=1 Tax=Oceanidesulfovibrio marinus TaxID=370038 RepID=A0A6P1ZEV7_9BACT|nr:GAF domain-containing protein [Oceanidesulfovibrio marinus]QJT08652.1 hypothetical protein E8L03_06810 [Oceanidesulfovibrio marinus]TVM32511.1 hypothetical protein DQK91_14650 [Oceanidesulfovibrio marinus]